MNDDPYKPVPPTPPWLKDLAADAAAKRERAEIALRFAVALLSNSSIHIPDDGSHPKSVASDSFIFADAFLAARDGAK